MGWPPPLPSAPEAPRALLAICAACAGAGFVANWSDDEPTEKMTRPPVGCETFAFQLRAMLAMGGIIGGLIIATVSAIAYGFNWACTYGLRWVR